VKLEFLFVCFQAQVALFRPQKMADTRSSKWQFQTQQEVDERNRRTLQVKMKQLDEQMASQKPNTLDLVTKEMRPEHTSLHVGGMKVAGKNSPVVSKRAPSRRGLSEGVSSVLGSNRELTAGRAGALSLSHSMPELNPLVTTTKITARDLLQATPEQLAQSRAYPTFLAPDRPPSRARARGGVAEETSAITVKKAFNREMAELDRKVQMEESQRAEEQARQRRSQLKFMRRVS
jgi:hypothetical protein